jgi:hypothetical protein
MGQWNAVVTDFLAFLLSMYLPQVTILAQILAVERNIFYELPQTLHANFRILPQNR